MMKDTFKMPLRFMRGSAARLILTVVALACGVALVCAIDLVNRAVLRTFTEVIDTMAGRAALTVTAGHGGLFAEAVATTVAAVEGVELAVPAVSATAFTADDSGTLLTVQGVDITNEAAVRVYEPRDSGGLEIDDPLVFLNQPDSIVLTRTFASRRGLQVGGQIELLTPGGRRQFTVRGMLEPQGIARVYGGNLAVMDLLAAEAAFARPGFINRVDIVVPRDGNVDAVAARLATALPAGLQVERPEQRKIDLQRVMQSLQAVLQGVALLGLVAAFLIAFNRLATVFERRVWQLGVMRAVGARTRALWSCLVTESLLLGGLGVAIGLPLGIALAHLLLPAIATTAAVSYQLAVSDTTLTLHPASLIVAALLGLGAALCAAVFPARRATQLAIASTIRLRGNETSMIGRRAWLLRGIVIAGTIAAVIAQVQTLAPAWGLVATVMVVIATSLLARPLVEWARDTAAPALHGIFGASQRLATANITQNPSRTVLTIAMITVGFAAIFWLRTISYSFEQTLTDILAEAIQSELVVSSAHIVSGFIEAPLDESVVAALRTVPGVLGVSGQRLLELPHPTGSIVILADDAPRFEEPGYGLPVLIGPHLRDPWAMVAAGTAIIVSSNFALHLHTQSGDTISLDTPSGPFSIRVAAISADLTSPVGTIEMSRELAQRLWHDHQVTRVFVRTAPEVGVEQVRAAIASQLGQAYGLRVLSGKEMNAYFVMQVRRGFAGVHALTVMVLIVVLIGVADTLAAGVAERTRELGALRAIGVRRRAVHHMVVAESVVLAALGLLLALVAGLGLGVLWVRETFPSLLGWTIELHIPYVHVGIISGIVFVVCFTAALLPARRAARIEPAIALRYE